MEAIHGRLATGALFTDDRSSIQLIEEGVAAKTPGAQEIIFRTSPANRGVCFTVDEKHVVAFAPPIVLILKHRHGDSDEMPVTRGVQPDVIFLAVEVRFPSYLIDLCINNAIFRAKKG